jgi:hypothetical protein
MNASSMSARWGEPCGGRCGCHYGGGGHGDDTTALRGWLPSAERRGWFEAPWGEHEIERALAFVQASVLGGPASLEHPREAAARLIDLLPEPDAESAHLDPFSDSWDALPGLHPGALFLSGIAALAWQGQLDGSRLDRLLLQATDASPAAMALRFVLGTGRPVFEPPRVPPKWLLPPARLRETLCAISIKKSALALGAFEPPQADAAGIRSLWPVRVCPAQTLQIRGSGFGAQQPAGTSVLVPSRGGGCIDARVVAWSDRVVTVEAPADIGPGCVGFLRGGNPLPFEVIDQLAGEVGRCLGPAGVLWGERVRRIGSLGPNPCPPCLPNDENRLVGAGAPVITQFSAAAAAVEPGTAVTLHWSCGNADRITIRRLGVHGPWTTLPQALPAAGTVTLGPFLGAAPVLAQYELEADNACGTVRRVVSVQLSRRPSLAVTGIEVVQAVQRADNSLPLAANRVTTVRVYVTSGLSDGFDFGAGPDIVDRLRVRLRARDPARGLDIDAGAPWNAPRAVPVPDRQAADGSINFALPLPACSGSITLEATVEAELPGGWIATAASSIGVSFRALAPQTMLPILVADTATPLPAPTLADFVATLRGPQTMQPFAEDGFAINPPLSLTLPTSIDLRRGFDWTLLTAMLATAIWTAPQASGIRCALVPNSGAYPWGGMALPRIVLTAPSLINQAGLTGTFAHELAHAYGLMHVNCGGPAIPFDSTLPLLTDEPGIDADARAFHPMGENEAMSYCAPAWVSTEHWNRMFNAIPV